MEIRTDARRMHHVVGRIVRHLESVRIVERAPTASANVPTVGAPVAAGSSRS